MKTIFNLLISILAIFATTYILPGVHVSGGWKTYIVLAVVLAIINMVIKPVLTLLTLPLSVITLGLFSIVLNALLIMLAAHVVPGFTLDGFWWAVAFGAVLSVVHFVLKLLER